MALSFYPEGDTVLQSDNELRTLHKIADSISTGGIGGGGLAGAGAPTITYPSGPPGGHAGTSYVDTLTGDIYWWYGTPAQWNP